MPKTLLIADDSKTIQQAISMTFAGEDVKLVAASDGEAALQAAKQAKPDLILADVTMPKMSGYELCQKVRTDAALKDVPVLLLGGGTPIDPAKAMAVGANGHMPKPFDSGKLIEHVKIILANPKAKPVLAPATNGLAKPAVAAPRPSAPPPPQPKPAVSPGGAGGTMVMARPPMPSNPAARPPTSNPPRPSAPPPVRPAPAAPPAAARPAPPISKPPVPGAPVARPPAPSISKPAPPTPAARPPPPPARPPVSAQPPALDDDEDIPLDEDVADEALAPAPTPLRPVPSSAHKPALSVVPPPGDGGESQLREALSRASREVIEKIAWEVVPELAETIIREELERLIKERGA
jgi:CheY-like chemotaxis protein